MEIFSTIGLGGGPTFEMYLTSPEGLKCSDFVFQVANKLPRAHLIDEANYHDEKRVCSVGDLSWTRLDFPVDPDRPWHNRTQYFRSLPAEYGAPIPILLSIMPYTWHGEPDQDFCRVIVPSTVAEDLGLHFHGIGLQVRDDHETRVRLYTPLVCLVRDLAATLSIPSAIMAEETWLDFRNAQDGYLCMPPGLAQALGVQDSSSVLGLTGTPIHTKVPWHEVRRVTAQ